MANQTDIVTLRQLVDARPFLTVRWVRSLVATGDLKPYSKVGGRLLFSLKAVDAVVAEGRERMADRFG